MQCTLYFKKIADLVPKRKVNRRWKLKRHTKRIMFLGWSNLGERVFFPLWNAAISLWHAPRLTYGMKIIMNKFDWRVFYVPRVWWVISHWYVDFKKSMFAFVWRDVTNIKSFILDFSSFQWTFFPIIVAACCWQLEAFRRPDIPDTG